MNVHHPAEQPLDHQLNYSEDATISFKKELSIARPGAADNICGTIQGKLKINPIPREALEYPHSYNKSL